MRTYRQSRRRGVGSSLAPLVLALVLTLAALLATDASDASTVLYVYDSNDAPAVPQYVTTSRVADLTDGVTLQSLQRNSDRAFLAVDRHAGRDDSAADVDDIVVRIGGYGRSRSHGVAIFRTDSERDDDRGTVVFTPPRLDVSGAETCQPIMLNVRAENRGKTALRIDGIRFDHDAFSLVSDPRGAILEPSQSLQISALFVSSQPEQLEAFIMLQTSEGEFALPVDGHTRPNQHGLRGLRVSVPIGARLDHTIRFHNPRNQAVRVSEAFSLDGIGEIVLPFSPRSSGSSPSPLSMWEVDSLSTKPIARFVFKADKPPGRYESSVRVVTSKDHFVVPIRIDIKENQFMIEPSEIDVGVFTNDHERRDVAITFHNTASHPVAIHALRIAELDGMDVSAELLGGAVIPPRTRVQRAVMLRSRSTNSSLQSDLQRRSGPCHAKLVFETNASVSDSFHAVQLRGFSTRGHLSYSLSQAITRFAAVTPETTSESKPADETESTTRAAQPDQSRLQELVLTNSFDTALELQSVSFFPLCPDATVESFASGLAAPASPFPRVLLRVRPDSALHPQTRVCSLQVETNATIHQVPVILYTGMVGVKSSRPVTENVDATLSPCSPAKKREDADTIYVKPCRQIVLDMGKVAMEGMLDEVVNITNTSPTELRVSIQNTLSYDAPFRGRLIATSHPDPHLPPELAALGVAWQQSSSTRKREATRDTNAGGSTASRRVDGTDVLEDTMAPGELLSVTIGMDFDKQHLGRYLEPLAVIETPFETIELLIRLETVKGRIEPDVRRIEIQSIHPGRLGYVRVPFVSTFEHDVSTRGYSLRHKAMSFRGERQREVFTMWRLPKVFLANTTNYATLMYFPAEYYAACQRGRFFADCFAPSATASPTSSPELSWYGSFVTASDIERLEKREQRWNEEEERSKHGFTRRVSVDVSIMTDAIHISPVQVATSLVRPRFFRNDVSIIGVDFPLTELLQQIAAYVNVFNPSDYAMDMELAIAEDDRHLFYECDEDMTEAECLREWQDIARERVEMATQIHNGSPSANREAMALAPMFFKRRAVRVIGQGHAQLGPIYFFPSIVGEWKTRMFVRNELTHIEPFAVAASGGFGQLTFTLLEQPQGGDASVGSALPHGGVISFATSELANLQDKNKTTLMFGSVKTLVVTNTGTFQTPLKSIRLFDMKGSKKIKAFAFSASGAVDSNGQRIRFWAVQDFVLEPGQELRFEIEFTTDCFRSRQETEMQITTRDGVTTHRLLGLLSVDASFQCRRQLWTERKVQLMDWLWASSSSVACVMLLLAGWTLARSRNQQQKVNSTLSCSSDPTVVASKARHMEEVTSDADSELTALLAHMERSSLVSPVESRVLAPTVAKLRASRHRKNEKLTMDEKPEQNDRVAVPPTVPVKDDGMETDKPITPKARKKAKSKSRSPLVMKAVASNSPSKLPEKTVESPVLDNQCGDDEETTVPEPSMPDVRGDIHAVVTQLESVKNKSKEQTEANTDTCSEKVGNENDLPMREETASEEESEDLQEETEDVALGGAFTTSPVEQSTNNGEEEDGVVLVGMHELEGFSLPTVTPAASLLLPPATQHRDSLGFDDDWSALSFDSLQSELGKLFVADDAPFDRTTDSQTVSIDDPDSHMSSLSPLSMAPPLLPMSSLFGSAAPSLLPPQPRVKAAKAAPPGFSPADANPEASRAAFERLLQPAPPDVFAMPSVDSNTSVQSAFSGRFSLFGPHLGQNSGGSSGLYHSGAIAPSNGHIGGSRVARTELASASRDPVALARGSRDSSLASLGGVELSVEDATNGAIGNLEL